MLIEAAKGGHTTVVQLLLDYPHSVMLSQQSAAASMLPGQVSNRDSPLPTGTLPQNMPQPIDFFQSPPNLLSEFSSAVLQEVPEAVRIIPQEETTESVNKQIAVPSPARPLDSQQQSKTTNRKTVVPKSRPSSTVPIESNLSSNEISQVTLRSLSSTEVSQMTLRSQPLPLSDLEDTEFLNEDASVNTSIIDFIKRKNKHPSTTPPLTDEGSTQKQQILEELHVSILFM